jgi:hypothetical protein
MKTPTPIRFSYAISSVATIRMALAAGLVAAAFIFAAASGRDFTIMGGFPISAGFVKLLAALSTAACLYTLVAARALSRQRKEFQFVELTRDGIIIPGSGSNAGSLTSAYSDILNLSLRNVANQQLLVITTRHGESRLLSSGFKTLGDFSQFSSSLQVAWLANKSLERTRDR